MTTYTPPRNVQTVDSKNWYEPSGKNAENYLPRAIFGTVLGAVAGAICWVAFNFVWLWMVFVWAQMFHNYGLPVGVIVFIAMIFTALGYIFNAMVVGLVSGYVTGRTGLKKAEVRNVKTAHFFGALSALLALALCFIVGTSVLGDVERLTLDYIAMAVVPLIALFVGQMSAEGVVQNSPYCEPCGRPMDINDRYLVLDYEYRAQELLKAGDLESIKSLPEGSNKEFTSIVETKCCSKCNATIVNITDRGLQDTTCDTLSMSAYISTATAEATA